MSSTEHLFTGSVLPRMALAADDRVLELGCGDGWACRAMAALISHGVVVGIDSSGDAIREARRLSMDFDNILYIQAEAEENPWQDNFFSHAVLIDLAPHLRDLSSTLQHLQRVLSPGGQLWVVGCDDAGTAALMEQFERHGLTVSVREQQLIGARK